MIDSKQKLATLKRKKRPKLKYPEKFQAFLLLIVFVLLILFFNISGIITQDVEFSKEENRSLAQKPSLSVSDLLDGSYSKNLDSYFSDQFYLRNSWIRLKVNLDLLLGKQESNGVYIGKDNYLMEIPVTPDSEWLNKNLKAIDDFAKRHQDKRVVMSVIPNSAYILSEKAPLNANVRNQAQDEKMIADHLKHNLAFIEVSEVLKQHSDENIFYKTDHHWTSLGAKYVFEVLANSLGIDNPITDYKIFTVSDSFSGSMASKSGYLKSVDEIQIMIPKTSNYSEIDLDTFVVKFSENHETCSLYSSEALKAKDQYTVFLGGNYSRVDIQTLNDNGHVLLLIKDSYANCFVQFLTPYYEKIIMIDPRYYYDEIEQAISKEQITDILFLYNMNTFLEDRSLADVLTVD